MGFIWKYSCPASRREVTFNGRTMGGVNIDTSLSGATIPDDEIPNLISALQNYMSRRAREMTRAANNGR